MLPRLPSNGEWNRPMVRDLFGLMRLNQYRTNWPIVLDALRQLWEIGKVSQLKSSFYEPVEKPKIR